MKRCSRFVLIGVLCMSRPAAAQESDFQWWPLVNISKTSGKFKFFFEEQVRLKNNASELYMFYSDVGCYYSVTKNFQLGPIWRPWWDRTESGFNQVNRFLFDVNVRNYLGKLEYSYRLRYQQMLRIRGDEPKEYFTRHKFELKYVRWKVKPMISTELFVPLFKTTPNFIDKARNTLGFEIPLTKHSAFIPLLMYIHDNSGGWRDLYIIGGGYYLIF